MANGVATEGKRTVLNGNALMPVGIVVAILLGGLNLGVQIGKWNASEAKEKAEIVAEIKRLNERHEELMDQVVKLREVDMKLYDSRQRRIELALRTKGIMKE